MVLSEFCEAIKMDRKVASHMIKFSAANFAEIIKLKLKFNIVAVAYLSATFPAPLYPLPALSKILSIATTTTTTT